MIFNFVYHFHRITIAEKELDIVREEFFKETEKKHNLEQRNERLRETKEFNFHKAFDDYRQFKDGIRMQRPCEREEVVDEMKSLWNLKKDQSDDISVIKKDIRKLDKEISHSKKELKKWTDYQATGRSNLDTHIKLLQEEIVSMKANYEIISG